MASDVASRDHYLTLALFSRRIIEALRELIRSGKRERLRAVLPAAIESLEAATGHHPSGYGLRVVRTKSVRSTSCFQRSRSVLA